MEELGQVICNYANYRSIDGCVKNGIKPLEIRKVEINGQENRKDVYKF